MRVLLPLLTLYRRHKLSLWLGLIIAIVTVLASLFLLSLSGWFLAASAVAGVLGISAFNYMLPAVGVRGCAIVRTAARYAERLISHNTTFKILSYLRVISFEKILPLSPLQVQTYQKSDLLNRFIADIDHLDHVYLKILAPCVSAIIATLAVYLGLRFFNPVLAEFIAGTLLLTILLMPIVFFRLSKTSGHRIVTQKNTYRRKLVAYLQGHTEFTLFLARPRFRAELDHVENTWLSEQQKQARLTSLSQSLVITLIGFLTVSVIFIAVRLDWNYHSSLLALFVFVSLAASELVAPLPGAFIYLGHVIASAKRIQDLFTRIPDITFPTPGVRALTSAFSVTLDAVTFYYPNQPNAALHSVSLTLKNNQHVALIGKTGGGKSTLLKLLTRAMDPTHGEIRFDGIPLQYFSEAALRRMISVIPQRIDILCDTLANNLRIAKPRASNTELIQIIHCVGLEKLLDTSEGLTLWLGEKGRSLSGGEIRRIGIARALLHNAPLIILDEPTESLDLETERQIVTLLQRVCQNKTLLMATHRLVDDRMFECVYHLEDGTRLSTPLNAHDGFTV